MKVSEKSLELNVGAELLALLRGPLGMGKAYLRGLTQKEEKQEGVDFFAHLSSGARILAFQFKAPKSGLETEPYRYTLVKEQHDLLFGLAQLAPGSVFYVFPFYVTPDKLWKDVPHLASDTWLLPIAHMPTSSVFGTQKTKVVRCSANKASVNPEYRMTALSEAQQLEMRGIGVEEFAAWHTQSRETQVVGRRPRNPWLMRGLRLAIVGAGEGSG